MDVFFFYVDWLVVLGSGKKKTVDMGVATWQNCIHRIFQLTFPITFFIFGFLAQVGDHIMNLSFLDTAAFNRCTEKQVIYSTFNLKVSLYYIFHSIFTRCI